MMKREILEAVFPGIKGEYVEINAPESWIAGFVSKGNVYRIELCKGAFSAYTLMNKEHEAVPIPIKAIHLISQYENQPK